MVFKAEPKICISAKAGYIGFILQKYQKDFHFNSSKDMGRKIIKIRKKEIQKRDITLFKFLFLLIT